MHNYIYIHVCCINNWSDVFSSLLYKIKDSGLYENITEIRCGILGDEDNIELFKNLFNDSKIIILYTSNNLNLYETCTINAIYEQSNVEEEFNVLYIHTKGVRHNNTNPCVIDWINYLCYFNIYQFEQCIDLLEQYDCIGVNLQKEPVYHYSGNFWWAKSEYIKKLNKCIYTSYNAPEFWLTETNIGKYISLHNSNINHYNERYSEDKYLNKK